MMTLRTILKNMPDKACQVTHADEAYNIYSVYMVKVDGKLEKRLLEGLQFVDWKKYVKKDPTVFVKPNFTYAS